MKNNLLAGFFFIFIFASSYGLSERKLITYIDSINSLASNHFKNNDITKSFNYLLENVKLSDSIHDDYGNAQANSLLGNIYSHMGLSKEAEKCYLIMLKKAIKISDNYLIASAYLSLGDIYRDKKTFDQLLLYYNNALTYALNSNVTDEYNVDKKQNILFDVRLKLSQIYINHNQADEAYMNLLEAEKNLLNNSYSKACLSYTYGLYYSKYQSFNLANKKFTQALNHLDKKSNDTKIHLLFSEIYKELSISLSNLDKNDEAYQALLKHNSYKEKLIKDEKAKTEKNAKSKFFIAEYKNIAQTANQERILQQKVSNKIKIVSIIISVATIILLVLVFILVKNYRSKQRLSLILKERNDLLEIAKNQAEKSSKLKTDFVSNVTHELRTPLYGVVGLTSLMLENNNLGEKDLKMLESLKYSGDYLLNLVNDILQMGKIESQSVDLKNISVNLKEMVNGIIGSFEYRLKESNNEAHILIDNGIPEVLLFDSVRLSQILMNLVGNSIKFTNNGKIWLRVILNDINDNNVTVRFEVEDTGTGIPDNQQESIFDNFSQVVENQNMNYQGTGLGLSIVKSLLGLFNSKIELRSQIGKGSTFSFNVTLDIDKDTEVKPVTKKVGKIVPLNTGYKILVVEDNKINQIVTKSLLKKANFECDVVENGLECIEAVSKNSYDLILMDINMPVMDGNEATKQIRKTNVEIPIIALTAADIDEVKKNLHVIGYDGIITKPFDNFEFFQVINAHIQGNKTKFKPSGNLVRVS
ncbi:signal transduction histidine kinase [Mariniflexile fucanivorans]|uniref:histidine kinase n=1 Tax=Mariniflexile fucanivorans TaxID=264023 RepID=A0A4R1RLF6_9FLAO|nr:response regulator [Mariniflexile fucanivorans]TCL67053.1 signal transduction histidine kinase [Mariniflexile fucanivorans]